MAVTQIASLLTYPKHYTKADFDGMNVRLTSKKFPRVIIEAKPVIDLHSRPQEDQ